VALVYGHNHPTPPLFVKKRIIQGKNHGEANYHIRENRGIEINHEGIRHNLSL
jgi:hypothetical protein